MTVGWLNTGRAGCIHKEKPKLHSKPACLKNTLITLVGISFNFLMDGKKNYVTCQPGEHASETAFVCFGWSTSTAPVIEVDTPLEPSVRFLFSNINNIAQLFESKS